MYNYGCIKAKILRDNICTICFSACLQFTALAAYSSGFVVKWHKIVLSLGDLQMNSTPINMRRAV